MKKFIDKIIFGELTPNQFILLYCLANGINVDLNFNPTPEKRALKEKGYLTEAGCLTEKVSILDDKDPLDPFYHRDRELEDKQFRTFAASLNQLFPLEVPRRGYGRSKSVKLVQDRLKQFMSMYPYDLSIIREATENYLERNKASGFKYLAHPANFILKGYDESTLALECELIERQRKVEDFGQTI